MALFDPVKKLFARRRSLEDIGMDELRRERIRLEHEEKRYVRRIDEIEEDKKALFMQGKDETSRRKQIIIARKIKEKEAEAKNIDRNLRLFSRQLRIVNGLVQLKENELIIKQSGISSIISRLDLQELQSYVLQATVDGEFHMDKFQDIISTLERSEVLAGPTAEDAEIMALVGAMQDAHDAEEMDPEAAERIYEEQISTREVDIEEEEGL